MTGFGVQVKRSYTILRRALDRQSAVAVIGPSQVDNTTLALEIVQGRHALYIDIELPIDCGKLAWPELFLHEHKDQLVILDEIHRTAEPFQVFREGIDTNALAGRHSAKDNCGQHAGTCRTTNPVNVCGAPHPFPYPRARP